MTTEGEAEIIDRLETIIKVLVLQIGPDMSLSERIPLLKSSGLDNATIAEVLNVTPATVRAILSFARRQRKTRAIRRGRRERT